MGYTLPYPPSRQVGRKQSLLGLHPTQANALVAAFFVFLAASWSLPKHDAFLSSILLRKNNKSRGFWPPKTLPKPVSKRLKIDVPKNMRFFIDLCFLCVFLVTSIFKI
jgi:hypothetical protein